ncbi:MAG: M28 family peptidase [Bacteroidetes bacterium]|nr:M28 family peptidase [Bacteroidota bacterium]
MRFFLFFFSIVFSISVCAQQINVAKLKAHVNFLSNKKLKGRLTGSQQELTAANYIAKNLKSFGLIPKGNISSYYYSYKFKQARFAGDTVGGKLVSGINVVAYLDNHCDSTIIISAHYDHLGLTTDQTSYYPGANDNASGVAALIELARHFSLNKRKEKFNILFICFSGHEQDFVGSKSFSEKPTIDFSFVKFHLNLDKLGSLDNARNNLFFEGLDKISVAENVLNEVGFKKNDLPISTSDASAFKNYSFPTVLISTGNNGENNPLKDEVKKLNFEGEKKVMIFITKLIEKQEEVSCCTCQKNRE